MEHIQKLLDKSDDLLDAEMTRTQSLIEDIKNLHVKYETWMSSWNTLNYSWEDFLWLSSKEARTWEPESVS